MDFTTDDLMPTASNAYTSPFGSRKRTGDPLKARIVPADAPEADRYADAWLIAPDPRPATLLDPFEVSYRLHRLARRAGDMHVRLMQAGQGGRAVHHHDRSLRLASLAAIIDARLADAASSETTA